MIQKLLDLVDYALSLLPQSPFKDIIWEINNSDGIAYLNWFIPVGRILEIMALWLAAILTYYLGTIILRWVKAIQ